MSVCKGRIPALESPALLSVSGESGTGLSGCRVVDAKKDGSTVTAGNAGATVGGGGRGCGGKVDCVGFRAKSWATVVGCGGGGGGGAGAAVIGCTCSCCNCWGSTRLSTGRGTCGANC